MCGESNQNSKHTLVCTSINIINLSNNFNRYHTSYTPEQLFWLDIVHKILVTVLSRVIIRASVLYLMHKETHNSGMCSLTTGSHSTLHWAYILPSTYH